MNRNRGEGRTIVIGGSIAGSMTARVLADYYAEVLIVDRDDFPEKPENRPCTPQAFHSHRFTNQGKQITEKLFPGFEEDLVALGASSSLNKVVYNHNQFGSKEGTYPRPDVKFSRALLEWVLRERVKRIDAVRFLPRHEGIRLLASPDQSAVTGLLVRERGGVRQETEIMADLVVDASGRSSKLASWLTDLGYEVPMPDKLKAAIGYSTRRYKLPSHLTHLAEKWEVINIAGQPAAGTYGGVFSFIENQVAEVLLWRPGGNYPSTDVDEFERSVASLPSPLIGEIVRELDPITPPKGYHVPELYRHHYEQMDRWPAGLLVLGDAYCIYDPIFGQGMTVAAMEAERLEACLREQRDQPKPDFENRVLQCMQSVIEVAWWLNCAADLRWQGVEYVGEKPLKGIDFGCRYMELFLKQGTTSPDWKLYGLYWAVNSLSLPPGEIFNPQMITDILEASEEGRQLREEQERLYSRPMEQLWEELVPFSNNDCPARNGKMIV